VLADRGALQPVTGSETKPIYKQARHEKEIRKALPPLALTTTKRCISAYKEKSLWYRC
jgi:hypothetical protein